MKAYEKHSIEEVRLADYIFGYKYCTTSKSLPTTTAALSNSLPPAATKNTPITGLFGQKSNSQSSKNVSNPSGLFGRASVTATTSTSSSAPSSFLFGGTGTTLSDNKSASSGGGLGYIPPSIFGSLFSPNSTSQTQLGEQNTNCSGSMFDTTPLLSNTTIESGDHQDTPGKYQRPKRTPVVDAKDLEIDHVKVVADHFSSSDKAGWAGKLCEIFEELDGEIEDHEVEPYFSVGTQVTVDSFKQIAGQPPLKVVAKVFKTGGLEEDDIEAEADDVEMLEAGWYYRLNRAPDGMVVGQGCVTYFHEDQLELDLGDDEEDGNDDDEGTVDGEMLDIVDEEGDNGTGDGEMVGVVGKERGEGTIDGEMVDVAGQEGDGVDEDTLVIKVDHVEPEVRASTMTATVIGTAGTGNASVIKKEPVED